ncbi:ABC transporter permease [Ochrovirga pacifica]|uniref:ABC transporter permease n=1 Tax=Ochrovirga pacifica TaxID=1042376 RepID=UPI0002559867|nr:ABC transporter permease [Ochrovirga pacifica]
MKDSIIRITKMIGLGFLEPVIRLIHKEDPQKNIREIFRKIIAPIASIIIFVFLWNSGANALFNSLSTSKIEKARDVGGDKEAERVAKLIQSAKEKLNGEFIISEDPADLKALENNNVYAVAIAKEDGSYDIKSGLTPAEKKEVPVTLPSPFQTKNAFYTLLIDYKVVRANKASFKEKTFEMNKKRVANGKKAITYTGRPSFVDQIKTSLKTVFAGFLLALFIAVPIGIIVGLSKTLRGSISWIIQIFKPVSPVVWLLLVTMIVTTLLRNSDSDSSFIISFISVGLCSMWATLVNTAMGVASVNTDYINVAEVLKLKPLQKITKVVLPASLPLIFTGLRITLSVAWMVLIAIELLAQSPGLGSFVWEEFQNGANDSNSKIIVAMFVIGLIGFALDRIMLFIQGLISFEKETI